MKSNVLALCVALLALGTSAAQAAPQSGFSVNGGLISSNTDHQYTSGIFKGQTLSYKGGGISLGIDYQIPINANLSINPFLMISGEAVTVNNTTINNLTANHNILGLQLRYWFGNGGGFVGGHIGSYSEKLTYTFNNGVAISGSASGGGLGLVGGWENPNGGFYAMGQLDSAKLNTTDANTKLSGFRLSIGYRWK